MLLMTSLWVVMSVENCRFKELVFCACKIDIGFVNFGLMLWFDEMV